MRLLPRSAAYRIGLLWQRHSRWRRSPSAWRSIMRFTGSSNSSWTTSIRQATASLMAEYPTMGWAASGSIALRERSTGNWLGFAVFASDGRTRRRGAEHADAADRLAQHRFRRSDGRTRPGARVDRPPCPTATGWWWQPTSNRSSRWTIRSSSLLALGFGAVLILGAGFRRVSRSLSATPARCDREGLACLCLGRLLRSGGSLAARRRVRSAGDVAQCDARPYRDALAQSASGHFRPCP